MATGQGSGEIDFGAYPGSNEATVSITGLTGIGAGSKAEAYFMGNGSTTDHTEDDHKYAPLFISLTCGTPGSDACPVYGRSTEKMQGKFAIRLVWAD